ncbi:MAG TPA: MASE1 domain-containing protein [Verrucomicrobiae bacterium]|nr:MASE1 domain-containing protein [Verrucomicrobiae bacterium]
MGNERYLLADAWKVAAIAAVYFVAGKLGLKLAFLHRSASPVWPPTGIALAVLLMFGYRLWPGVWLGAFLVNITTAGSVLTSIGIAGGNTLEAILGAWMIDRFANGRHAFDRAADIFRYALVGPILSTILSATVGVTCLAVGGYAPWFQYGSIWQTWWLGDAVSALIVAPFLLIWGTRPGPGWNRRQITEAALTLAFVWGISYLAFSDSPQDALGRYPRFLLYPTALLAAYRFEQRGAISAAGLISLIAIFETQHGNGPFASINRNDSLILLQVYLSAFTLTNLVLGALVSENRRNQAALRDNERQIRHDLEDTLRLQEMSRRFVQHEDFQSLLDALLDASIAVTEAQKGTLQLREAHSGVLTIAAQRGFEPPFLNFFKKELASDSNNACGLASQRGERLVIQDITKSDLFVGTPAMAVLLEAGVRSVQCTPLYSRSGDLVGMLNSHYGTPHRPEPRELRMLDLLVRQAADLIEQRRSAAALRENQARYTQLIGSAMDAIITIDANQRVVLFNPAAERMFGCPAMEAMGASIDRFIPRRFHEAHRQHIEEFGRRGVTNRGMGALGALSAMRASGEEFPIEASISHMEVEGQKLFTVILRDITERKRTEAELEAWRHELELRVEQRTVELAMAHRQLQAQIEERKRLEVEITRAIEGEQLRLGQELHDGLGQQLAGISYMMGALKVKMDRAADPGARDARKIEKLLQQSVEQIRNLARGFYPVELERRGLFFALKEIAHTTEQSFGVRCVVRVEEPGAIEPDGPAAIQLFRIAQEAVHNAVKHAQASQITIRFTRDGEHLSLIVKDDGVGLPAGTAETKGMGLRIMDHRARMIGARFEICVDTHGGTIVACSLPIMTIGAPPPPLPVRENLQV